MKKTLINLLAKYIPKLYNFLLSVRDEIEKKKPSIMTKWGFYLAGNDVYASGDFEVIETEIIRSLLDEVDIFVNVGANIGYYCCHALSFGKDVVAIEPIEKNLYYLLSNVIENNWANNIEIIPVALGDKNGILNIWGSGTAASLVKGWASIPECHVKKVPILTLDRVLGNSIFDKRALILVDIEGAELMMLLGAKNTLKASPRPIWFVEICLDEHQPDGNINLNFLNTFRIFIDNGYSIFMANKEHTSVSFEEINSIYKNPSNFKQLNHNYIFR